MALPLSKPPETGACGAGVFSFETGFAVFETGWLTVEFDCDDGEGFGPATGLGGDDVVDSLGLAVTASPLLIGSPIAETALTLLFVSVSSPASVGPLLLLRIEMLPALFSG